MGFGAAEPGAIFFFFRTHRHGAGGGVSREIFVRANVLLHPFQVVMFFPPVGFGLVEEGLYRSALPNEINYPFLERLRLKTIIYLYPDDDIDAQL